jgi:valyl-tRNA synthetase
MPFVTEQIWSEIYGEQRMLIVEKWPKQESITENTIEFETIRNIVTGIRTLRADNKIEPIKKLDATISAGAKLNLIKENSEVIKALARLGNLDIVESAKKSSTAAGFVEGGVEVFIELAGAIDLDKEKERLQKEFETLTKYINGIENKLANEEFVRNAPPAVIEKERQKLAEAQVKLDKIEAQL